MMPYRIKNPPVLKSKGWAELLQVSTPAPFGMAGPAGAGSRCSRGRLGFPGRAGMIAAYAASAGG